MTSATTREERAAIAATIMIDSLDLLPPRSPTGATTTGLDLNRDVLSEIFSHLGDPQDLSTVPCVCRHWRRAAEEGGDEGERLWKAVAESLGLGLEEEKVEEEEENEEEGEEATGPAAAAAAVAATLDRRALRSGAPLLPAGSPSSTWRDRVRAAWPELCFECRKPNSGRRRPKQQREQAKSSSSLLPPARTLSLRHCHGCSSASASADRQTRLVDAPEALRILRSGGGEGNEEEEGKQSSDDEPLLLLLLSKLPRSLDVRPRDPRFRTVELFRRRDVRALALGFERDIYF